MRYFKVLFTVLCFFFVMMFFVQNYDAMSYALSLKLDLYVFNPLETKPIPMYFLLLATFLLGALLAISMLIWDRVTLTARLMLAKNTIRSLQKDQKRNEAAQNTAKNELPKGKNGFVEKLTADKAESAKV